VVCGQSETKATLLPIVLPLKSFTINGVTVVADFSREMPNAHQQGLDAKA
jgi:hypothetical protein